MDDSITEPTLRVGLAQQRTIAQLTLAGSFLLNGEGQLSIPGGQTLTASALNGAVRLCDSSGRVLAESATVVLEPATPESSFVLHAMTVGIDFHWQHNQDLTFGGTASLEARGMTFDVVNGIALESYLTSVISSEMSAESPPALLSAHAVISRSWLLAQLRGADQSRPPSPGASPIERGTQVIRWRDREDHPFFDVCADDHCQRYQGLTRTSSRQATGAVVQTRGQVLHYNGTVCDARYSKACGGMTEVFETAWADTPIAYLQSFADGQQPDWELPLTDERHATAFIEGNPAAYCNTTDTALLSRVLPALDHATTRFYRWETTVSAVQVRDWIKQKLELDVGQVTALVPLERGPSGRLVRLEIVGDAQRVEVGKELEIRRVLSDSHLYSSAFVVRSQDGPKGRVFHLRGSGWGHGVGLCQIGAAVMADHGHTHEQILTHYFRGASLSTIY